MLFFPFLFLFSSDLPQFGFPYDKRHDLFLLRDPFFVTVACLFRMSH